LIFPETGVVRKESTNREDSDAAPYPRLHHTHSEPSMNENNGARYLLRLRCDDPWTCNDHPGTVCVPGTTIVIETGTVSGSVASNLMISQVEHTAVEYQPECHTSPVISYSFPNDDGANVPERHCHIQIGLDMETAYSCIVLENTSQYFPVMD
jgi:hypothetical protein